jgi:signal transduction histidine kinase
MWFSVQIAAYVSLVLGYLLLLALAVRHRFERGRAQRLLETILLLAAVWTVGLGLLVILAPQGWWSFVWRRTAQVGLVILALLTAGFAGAYVQRPSRRWLQLAFVALMSALAVALDVLPDSLLLGLPVALRPWLGRTELATLLLVIAWMFSTVVAWGTSVVALRRAVGSKHRNRIRYLLTSLLGFTVGDMLVLIGGIPDVYVGLAARLLGFCIVAFAVLRYDLPDVRRWTLATLRVGLLVSLAVLLYLAALLMAAVASSAFPGLPHLAVAAPFAAFGFLVVAIIDVVLGPRLHRLFDRILMGRDHDVQKALRDYSQRVNLILNPERLADATLEWLQTTFHVQRPAFILLTPQGDDRVQLRILRATTSSLPPARSFAMDSRFIVHFSKFGRPLSQYDLDMLTWFQTMPADERQWLRDLALDLYVPILVAGKPVALLALGPKVTGQPYSEEDLEALMILAGQTGTALENARLMDDLRAVQDDLHHLGTELAETNRQLARLDQAKTDFITIASHELRTPLTQIYGYSDILARLDGDDLSDAQVVREFVDGISRGATRLKQVVDAMVDVSLIETGALKINPVVVPLKLVVDNAIETIRPAISERRLVLTPCDLADLPYIQADGARLEQVFVSLLSNAVKFTPDGGEIVVSGHLATSSPDGDCVEVLIADTGIGIDPDQQDLIFGKFYRSENPMQHSTDPVRFKGAGPGLGLAIAKGIVDAHKGRIWVESPGRNEKTCPGSIFHVRLPIGGPKRE